MPIAIVHRYDTPYLPYVLNQLRRWNPRHDIVLLSDPSTRRYRMVEHVDLAAHSDGARVFADVYRHLSTHGREWEQFCFQRFFVLRDWARDNGIDRLVVLDSDVMVYIDLVEDLEHRWADVDFTLSIGMGGGNAFINRVEVLEELCDHLTAMYEQPRLAALEQWFGNYTAQGNTGGVCDMIGLHSFGESTRRPTRDTGVVRDGSIYDPAVTDSHGFAMLDGIKRFVWKDDAPWGCRLEDSELVRFNAVHFQGSSKAVLPGFYHRGHLRSDVRLRRQIFMRRVHRASLVSRRVAAAAVLSLLGIPAVQPAAEGAPEPERAVPTPEGSEGVDRRRPSG